MKKLIAVLLVLLLLIGAGALWALKNYQLIDGAVYPKNAASLDLRGKDISLSHYEAVRNTMPDCEILWDVPLQSGPRPCDIQTLAVSALSDENLALLSYFPQLQTLDARRCQDLSWLPGLKQARPELEILFELALGGTTYPQDAVQIQTAVFTDGDLALLPHLTDLKEITLTEGIDPLTFEKLDTYCKDNGIQILFSLDGQLLTEEVTQLTVPHITEAQARLLMLLPQLETLHLPEPEAAPATLLALAEVCSVTWEKTVLGVTFSQDTVTVDLTEVISLAEGQSPGDKTAYQYGSGLEVMGTKEEVPSSVKVVNSHPLPDKTADTAQLIAELEAALAYLPKVEKLELCGAWLDNEAMAQFREDHREDYEVVWTVRCGALATRTDTTFFMPTKYHIASGSFAEWDAYNLRYCEKIVAMDLGHMSISDLEFLYFMPDMTYLDIAITHVQDLTPLASCKKLVFLVMHTLSRELDYSPLLECTALEDLNISDTVGDLTPILQMKQLKTLWLVGWDDADVQRAKAALPDTRIGEGHNSPNRGWRELPNYFKMRDAMLMFYMD